MNAQVMELRDAGAEKVFRETASGARSDRAQLRRVLAELDKGDVLRVTRLDRLARLTRDLLNTVEDIAAKKARFKSLGDTWADTTTAHGMVLYPRMGMHRSRRTVRTVPYATAMHEAIAQQQRVKERRGYSVR